MKRTFLPAVLLAICAPLSAAVVTFDSAAGNAANAPFASGGPSAKLAQQFIAGIGGELESAALHLGTSGSGKVMLEIHDDAGGMPADAAFAKADALAGADHGMLLFTFGKGYNLVAGQTYWAALAAMEGNEVEWFGEEFSGEALHTQSDDGAWDKVSGFRLAMTVSVCGVQAPVILAQPQSVSILPGESATLAVTLAGDGPMAFQWCDDTGMELPGANHRMLTVAPTASIGYYVRVSNGAGAVCSQVAFIVVQDGYVPPAEVPPVEAQPPFFQACGALTLAQTAKAAQVRIGRKDPNQSISVALSQAPYGLVVSNIRVQTKHVMADFLAEGIAPGTYYVIFVAVDDNGLSTSTQYTVEVTPNTAPVIGGLADQTLDMNGEAAMSIALYDAEETEGLTVSLSFDNVMLLDASSFKFVAGSEGQDRILRITPRFNSLGAARVTLTTVDAGGLSASATFMLAVGDATTGLWMGEISNQMLLQGEAASIALNVLNVADGEVLEGGAFSADQALIQDGMMQVQAQVLSFQPVSGATGEAMITVFVARDGVTFSRCFTVMVAGVMIDSATAQVGSETGAVSRDAGGACSAAAGGGLGMLALAGLPVLFRRRK